MNTVPGQREKTTGSPRKYLVATVGNGRQKQGRARTLSVFQKRRHQSHDSGQASGQFSFQQAQRR
jgi:hypothetical protein